MKNSLRGSPAPGYASRKIYNFEIKKWVKIPNFSQNSNQKLFLSKLEKGQSSY